MVEKCVLCDKETTSDLNGAPLCDECYMTENQETFDKKVKEKYKCTVCFDTGVASSRIGALLIHNPCVSCKGK